MLISTRLLNFILQMIQFTTTILKFDKQGEKTGWMYIHVTAVLAEKLNPGVKKSFRVKGKFDEYIFKGVTLLPMGGGDFIIAFNATMRKGTCKRNGDKIKVQLEIDRKEYVLNPVFMDCLADDPRAMETFKQMPRSHQNYYSKWIESAKTEATQTKRIAMAVNALANKLNFGQMLRDQKKNNEDLMG